MLPGYNLAKIPAAFIPAASWHRTGTAAPKRAISLGHGARAAEPGPRCSRRFAVAWAVAFRFR
jgi:hypothetical protein